MKEARERLMKSNPGLTSFFLVIIYMIKIYLVRHTEYENPRGILPGRLPVPLSETGIKNAQRLQKYFEDKEITKIYSSEVLRCKQTAESIADNASISIEFDQRLLETFSAFQGYWVDGDWKHFWIHRQKLGGESYGDIYNRTGEFFEQINWEENRNYIICSHGDVLYSIYQRLKGIAPNLNAYEDGNYADPPGYQPKGSIKIAVKENATWEIDDHFILNDQI